MFKYFGFMHTSALINMNIQMNIYDSYAVVLTWSNVTCMDRKRQQTATFMAHSFLFKIMISI